MIVIGNSTIKDVSWISREEKQNILNFFQGAVYAWCNSENDGWFSVPIFMGGKSKNDWGQTPLGILYDRHISEGKSHEDAWELAGKEAGKLLKIVVENDTRNFETREAFPAREYRWKRN